MTRRPILLTTEVAAMFIVRVCKNQPLTPENIKEARTLIYYWAKRGHITRHGEAKRGQALWDLHELAAPYSASVTVVDNG